ncbi:pilus assembly protein PilM [Christensenellaceae bacterium OttesenSCG-928-L17]|nr:pilus assembly protein PilM [Christensenellaceae bacterium OttesenSCG-928-L17]
MAISIYCSAMYVHVVDATVSGKNIKVKDFFSQPVPEGTIINGLITDEEALVNVLKQLMIDKVISKSSVSLTIDSSNILMRTINAPMVSQKSMMDFVKNELSIYMEDGTENIYDYAVLEPKLAAGGGSILAIAASRALIDSYEHVFSAAKLKLENINLGLNCQIKFAQFIPQLQNETFILTQMDGNNLVLVLYNKGKYVLANRYRLLYTYGTSGWYEEFDDHISSMVQFNKGQKNNEDISIVYADLNEAGHEQVAAGLRNSNLELKPFPGEGNVQLVGKAAQRGAFEIGKYQFALGNLLKKRG